MAALRIGDEPLTPEAVVAAARGGAIEVELTAAARERIVRSREAAEAAAAQHTVYGRTTGVGANRHVVGAGDRPPRPQRAAAAQPCRRRRRRAAAPSSCRRRS